MQREFYTVAEFAIAVGKRTQSLYQRKGLNEYFKTENGIKVIDAAALSLYGVSPEEAEKRLLASNGQAAETPESDAGVSAPDGTEDSLLKLLQDQVASLEQEKQDLLAMLAKKDETIETLTNKLVSLVEEEQKITKQAFTTIEQAQFLHAAATNALEAAQSLKTENEPEPDEPEKRGLRGWWGSRKGKK